MFVTFEICGTFLPFLPRASMRKLPVRLSLCLSVRLSNAWIVTKRKKLVLTFLYHMKD